MLNSEDKEQHRHLMLQESASFVVEGGNSRMEYNVIPTRSDAMIKLKLHYGTLRLQSILVEFGQLNFL